MTRLAQEVAARQSELGLTDREIKGKGGPSPETMQRIRDGHTRLSLPVRRRLERALHWPAGAVDAYLATPRRERRHAGPHRCSAAGLSDAELLEELGRRLAARGGRPPVE